VQSSARTSLASAPYRFAVVTANVTFIMLLLGGIVHGTGSSLACPDWPLCHGSAFPEMTGGVEFEHSHRMLGIGIGLLTIALLVLSILNRKRDRWLPLLGVVALAAVSIQGVLGGITVIYQLPTLVSWAHLSLSMAYFSFLIYIAVRSRPAAPGAAAAVIPSRLRLWLGIATVAVYLQVSLGGLVRHTGAGIACLDVPFCGGELWQSSWHATAKLQMIHRYAGAAVGLLVITVAVKTWLALRGAAGSRRLRLLALAAPVLVLIQISLGLLSVLSLLGLVQVTAHLGVGALLLANMWLLYLVTRPAAARAEAPVTGPLAEVQS
jgi:heme A synthase